MSEHQILIVDDEPNVAFFFQKNLELVDDTYTVRTVNSGAEAVRELQTHRYDLMITDLRMPQMDGLELMTHTRRVSPKTQVILVTAYGTNDIWKQAHDLDAFRALSKPIKMDDLITCVQEALQQANTTAEGILTFTAEHFEKLTAIIETLRRDLSARAIILAASSGTILAYAGSVEALAMDTTVALISGSMAASIELAHQLKYPRPVHLSYFEGPPYDLYTTNINDRFFLMSIHDRQNHSTRIGLVWHYMQRTTDTLSQLLQQTSATATSYASLNNEFMGSLQNALDDFFAPTIAAQTAVVTIHNRSSQAAPSTRKKLQQILTQFGQQTGIKVEMHLEALESPLALPIRKLLLHTVSAILKNTYAHSEATLIGISFTHNNAILNGRIVDNGIGFDMHNPPLFKTLQQLQDEFRRKQGSLTITSQPYQGTQINFKLPTIV